MIGISLILISYFTALEAFTISVTNYDGETRTDVKIECANTAERLHPNFAHVRFTVSEIDTLHIQYCGSSDERFSLLESIRSLGVTKVNHLKIEDPKTPITREFLKDLSLDTLEFNKVNVATLPGNVLQDVQLHSKLIFNDCNLREIPQGLFQHASDVGVLKIEDSMPVKLRHDDLVSLTQLKELELSANRRMEIDEGALSGLVNLKVLYIIHSELKALPANVFHNLKNLRELNINVNSINELIPTDLLHITDNKLEIFRMINNKGKHTPLPAGFFKDLHKLQIVQLSNNRYTSLPADLFSRTSSLKTIVLKKNQIVELPVGLFNSATELTELDISENQLTILPENIFSATKLRKLMLNNNRITTLTEGNVNGLDNLKTLNISKNPLSNVQPSVCNKLKSVKTIIGLTGCPSLNVKEEIEIL